MAVGRLIVIGTPIGNLGDISPRALAALDNVDLIAAEDTRRTRKLLAAYDLHTPLVSYHRDNQATRTVELVGKIGDGATIALVSDAGMPAIADPGSELVAACAAADLEVEVVPGPSSVLHALVASGLPTGRFVFESFLPRKGQQRRARLDALVDEERTMIIFEAPNRVAKTLRDLAVALGGDRRCAVCRELTKLHEEVFRGSLDSAAEAFEVGRGEFVIVVEGATRPENQVSPAALEGYVSELLAAGKSVRDAAAVAARELGVRRKDAYEAAIRVRR